METERKEFLFPNEGNLGARSNNNNNDNDNNNSDSNSNNNKTLRYMCTHDMLFPSGSTALYKLKNLLNLWELRSYQWCLRYFISLKHASSLTLSICLNILSTLFSGVSSSFGKSIILPYEQYKEYCITH